MSSLSVVENIQVIQRNIENAKSQIGMMEKETYRLEGMLKVFDNMKQLGIETIPVPPPTDIKEENEVNDNDNESVSPEGEPTDEQD